MENLINEKNIETLDGFISTLPDDILNGDFEEIYKRAPITEDTTCGYGAFRGRILQK